MRDIVVTIMVLGLLPLIIRHAWLGILAWSWLSYMNPHKLAWGFAYGMPFAQIVAITFFVSILITSDKRSLKIDGFIVVWLIYLVWMCITTALAFYPDRAFDALINVFKIQLFTFLTLIFITNWKRLEALLWVIYLSIGFYTTKGGVFTLMTGGSFHVYGPGGSELEENNALAVAGLIILPIGYYFYKRLDNKWARYAMLFSLLSTFISVLGSQSRGALLAILAVAGFFWLKSQAKLASALVLVVMGAIGFMLMPQSWHERMDTISEYEEDESAMGRINSWAYSLNLANDRITGGGMKPESKYTFALYAPDPNTIYVAHSIYFGVLGEHGWPGLLLFLGILWLTWRILSKIIRESKNIEDFQRYNLLARMLQISLIAYLSGGAFLSLAYFDLPWHIVAIAWILRRLFELEKVSGGQPAKEPEEVIVRPGFA